MKKSLILGTGLCVALMFTSCKSSESKYRQAYEHAKNNTTTVVTEPTVVETPVVTPITTTPTTTTVVANDNTPVRTEDLQVVDGAPLKAFSVVIGSFGVKANAEAQARTLRSSGYEARIAFNSARNMYRVVATTFANKADAVASRDQLRSKYPDAWLLFQK